MPNREVLNPLKSSVDGGKHNILDIILQPLEKRNGCRHLWLGDSGMGKTVANDALIRWILKHKMANIILTIDDKDAWEVQYKGGIERVNPAHLETHRPHSLPEDKDRDARLIVFRGIAATRQTGPGVDNLIYDVVDMAWRMVREAPSTIVINIDELADATNGSQHWKDPLVAATYKKGRGVGISLIATTQLPQELPRAAFGLSETIGIFRMTAREAEYLVKYRVIPQSEVENIEKLDIGEFRLFRKSKPLDPNIYKFPLE